MKNELFKKVYIKSVEDLPRDGVYISCSHNHIGLRRYDSNAEQVLNTFQNISSSWWINNIEYYLQPIEQSSPSPVVVPDDLGEIIFNVLNNWVYNETNDAGTALNVIDAGDLPIIIFKIVNELKSRLKQGYPEEFVEFLTNNIKREYHLSEKIYWLMYDQGKQFKSLPELYQFWQDNIKDK